jgi:CheY-like chemotaxis protein
VEATRTTLVRLIGEDVAVDFHPGKDLWITKIDPSQLDQIFINLAVNARDAMPDGGALTVETGNVEIDDEYCTRQYGCVPGEYVLLSVSDSGSGMDRETLSHVFEPFFTTKEFGKGTGLGLATVYGIVKQNGGFINVYSEPGKGTTFKVYIPRLMDAPGTAEASDEAAEAFAETGAGAILLVEDDDMVRRMTASMLEEIGYTVFAAETPPDAISLCEKKDLSFDLLITDVVMPGMNGRELWKTVKSLRPGIGVLFMSGYTPNVITHRGILEDGVHFLQKPFTGRALAQKVREAIGRP